MFALLREFVSRYLNVLIYPPAALVISAAITWLCIRLLPRFGMVDIPHGRHDHAKPTPRGGGIAIIIAFFVVAFALSMGGSGHPKLFALLRGFAAPSAVIMITGLIDDRYELPSWIKLLAQIVVGVMAYYLNSGFYEMFGYVFPLWLGLPLTVFWVVGVINAFNLIDGLDGLAAGLACVSSLILAAWGIVSSGNPAYVALSLIFCGACLGFLIFNFSPAQIFMGDTGSMFLGLFFALLCNRYASHSVTASSLLVPLLAIGVPVIDVFLAVWRRVMRRISNPEASGIMSGDHDHLHHRLMSRLGSKSRTALALYLLMAGIGISAVGAVMLKNVFSGAIYIVLLIGVFVVVRLADIEILDSFGCIVRGLRRPSRRLVLVIVHPLIDYVLISLSYLVAYFFFFEFDPGFSGSLGYVTFCMPLLLVLYCSDVYRTYWLRAGINRYYRLSKALVLGGILALALLYALDRCGVMFDTSSKDYLYGGYCFFFILVLMLVAGERFLVRYLESFGVRSLYLRVKSVDVPIKRLVLVGGGIGCRLFIQNLFCRHYLNLPVNVLGLVDNDPALRHLNVYGFNVLGGTGELDSIYDKTPFDMLVVTTAISEEAQRHVSEFAERRKVELGVFFAETKPCVPEQLKAELARVFMPPADDESGKGADQSE